MFQLHLKKTGKIAVLLAFSFFVSGCHTGRNPVPVPKATIKKETAGQATESLPHSINETKTKNNTETGKEIIQKRPVSLPDRKMSYDYATAQRNPFALPAALREQQSFPVYNQKGASKETSLNSRVSLNRTVTNHNNSQQTVQTAQQEMTMLRKVTPYPPEPCVAGIFDNGKEKFALVRWEQAQGVFRCGESLGNGYYVKEITANSVLLGSEQNHDGTTTVRLTLQ